MERPWFQLYEQYNNHYIILLMETVILFSLVTMYDTNMKPNYPNHNEDQIQPNYYRVTPTEESKVASA